MGEYTSSGLHAQLFPSGRFLAGLFANLVGRWHTVAPPLVWTTAVAQLPPAFDGLEAQIEHLGLINCFQWHLEDECRDHYDDQPLLGRLKYQIDRSNRRRVQAIDAIDETIVQRLTLARPEPEDARLALVTPGALFDRLVILELKRFHASERPGAGSVLPLLGEQIEDLCQGIDETLEDLALGRRQLKFYCTVKLYGTKPGQDEQGVEPSRRESG